MPAKLKFWTNAVLGDVGPESTEFPRLMLVCINSFDMSTDILNIVVVLCLLRIRPCVYLCLQYNG